MKKFLLPLLALSFIAFAACGPEDPIEEPDTEQPDTEQPTDSSQTNEPIDSTKYVTASVTCLAEGGYVWTEDDVVTALTKNGKLIDLTIEEGAGTSTAVFAGIMEKDDEVADMAAFPSGVFAYDGEGWIMTVPELFTDVAEAEAFMPMAGVKNPEEVFVMTPLMTSVIAHYVDVPASNEACVFKAGVKISGDFAIDFSGDSPVLTLSSEDAETENVIAVGYTPSEDGTAEFVIPVPAAAYETATLNLGSADGEWVMETSLRTFRNLELTLDAQIEFPKVRIYDIKQYGSKVWFVEACKEEGADGLLGRTVDFTKLTEDQLPNVTFEKCGMKNKQIEMGRDEAFLSQKVWTHEYGKHALEFLQNEGVRYYTWFEAMTGKAGTGQDDVDEVLEAAGVTFDGSESEFSAQLQGCCPEGYHVSNLNDWWDLLHAIKTEYNVPDNVTSPVGYHWPGDATLGYDVTIGDGTLMNPSEPAGAGYTFDASARKYIRKEAANYVECAGRTETVTKEQMLNSGTDIYNLGNVTPWLIGPHTAVALYKGGLWNHLDCNWHCVFESPETESDKAASARFSTYIKDGGNTGFNWYQFGSFTSKGEWATDNTTRLGDWVGVWLPGTVQSGESVRGRGFCIRREAGANGSGRHHMLSELFPNYDQSSRGASIPVRCVKNY